MNDAAVEIWEQIPEEGFEISRYTTYLHRINIVKNLRPQDYEIILRQLDKAEAIIKKQPDTVFIYLAGLLSLAKRYHQDGD
jgi:hypothetical protein